MKLFDFFKKFWVSGQTDEILDFRLLPLSNVVDYQISQYSQEIRPFTVEIYNLDKEEPVLIATDDGSGRITPVVDRTISVATGDINTVNYITGRVTITWEAFYLANRLINPPRIEFKYISESKEEHMEMLDFLASSFGDYKEQELDAQLNYYKSDKIPSHRIETLANEHNWTLDRFYSETDEYFRRQMYNLYGIYKSKRKLDGIAYAISVIKKRVKLYNYLAKRGADEAQRKAFYEAESTWTKFNTDDLIEAINNETLTPSQLQTLADSIENIYSLLYSGSGDYYPTKHFLLDLALDIVNDDGSLLNTRDLSALRNYILKIKSSTQYPHFTASLNINALSTLVEQNGTPFDFYLLPSELLFSVNQYETISAGPNGVFSRAITGTGAWEILPLIMNEEHYLNEGLFMNMGLSDIPHYITQFRLGTGSYSVIDNTLTDLQQPVFTGTLLAYTNDSTHSYYTCTVDLPDANDIPLTEFGLFTSAGLLGFYCKFPPITKLSTHTLTFRIKIQG